jgi:hypothetical protein
MAPWTGFEAFGLQKEKNRKYKMVGVWVVVLVIVLVVVLALLAASLVVQKRSIVGGGTVIPIKTREEALLTAEIYEVLKDYIRECGTKHAEDYLVKAMALSRKDKLRNMIDDIVYYSGVNTVEDFLLLTGLKYIHFIPPAKRCMFQEPIPELDDMIEKFYEREITTSDNYVKFMIPGNRYYKFAPGYLNKSLAQIKKAKHKAFTIDKVALLVPISQMKKILNNQTDRDELIRIIKNLNIREYDSNLLLRILQRGKISLLEDLRWEREARERQKIIELLEKKQIAEKTQTENLIKSAIDTYNKKPRSENIQTRMDVVQETKTIEPPEPSPQEPPKPEEQKPEEPKTEPTPPESSPPKPEEDSLEKKNKEVEEQILEGKLPDNM